MPSPHPFPPPKCWGKCFPRVFADLRVLFALKLLGGCASSPLPLRACLAVSRLGAPPWAFFNKCFKNKLKKKKNHNKNKQTKNARAVWEPAIKRLQHTCAECDPHGGVGND